MPAICLLFRIHLPYILKKTTFFDFGEFPDLIDENKSHQRIVDSLEQEILPAIEVLYDLFSESGGSFRCSVYFSGIYLDLIKRFRPADQQGVSAFLNNSHIEPVVSAYFHPLIPMPNTREFLDQVLLHRERIYQVSGKKSCVFCSPNLHFREGITKIIGGSGFKGMIVTTVNTRKNRKFLGTVFKVGGLKLIQIPETISDGLIPGGDTDNKILRKKLRRAARLGYNPIFIPIDLHDPDPLSGSGLTRMLFIKKFISDAMTSGEYVFRSPSEILNEPGKIPEISEKDLLDSTALPETILEKEACRYLYSLEKKIKNTGDEELIYRWRMLQSAENLEKLLPAKKGSSRENETHSQHEIYLDYMNALSSLDIYARKIQAQIN
jgi:alpha-amylase